MTTYELLYLTPLQESDGARAAIRDRVSGIIQEHGGAIVAVRPVARQRLSYPIRKLDSGEYVLVEFHAPPAVASAITHDLHLQGDLLRSMLTPKNEKVRAVGPAVEAMERAHAQQVAAKEAAAKAEAARSEPQPEPAAIEDLDRRLEEILGKEMV